MFSSADSAIRTFSLSIVLWLKGISMKLGVVDIPLLVHAVLLLLRQFYAADGQQAISAKLCLGCGDVGVSSLPAVLTTKLTILLT